MFTFKKKLTEVEEQLTTLMGEHDALKKINDETLAKNRELEDRIAALTAEPVNMELFNEKTSLLDKAAVTIEEQIKTIETLNAQVKELTDNKSEFDAAVAAKALEITQSQGIPPLSCKPSARPASTISNGDLIAQYEALASDPVKQRKYWEENREVLVNILKGNIK